METTIITAINNTGSHRTIDLLIGAEDPNKKYYPHNCPHNDTTYLNVCDGDGCIDPTSGWKPSFGNGKIDPRAKDYSAMTRQGKCKRIDDHAIEQYRLAGIPLASATISSPAPVAGSDSNAAAAPAASSGNGLALASVPGAGANTVSGLNNNGFLAALLSSGWQLVHPPSGPAGAGQYLVNPSSGASFPVEGGNAFFSGRGIGFGPNSGAAAAAAAAAVAGGGAIPSTPTAASTPGRGGLGGGGAAIAAAAAANGSGTRDGVKALVPEGWQVIWLAAGPAGPGQYLLDPHGQMVPYVEGSNAFASGHGLGFSPYGAAAMPSTPSSSVQNKVASASAPFFGSFPNNVIGPRRMPTVIPDDVSNVIPSEAPLPPTPGSTAASKKDFDRLTTLLETSIDINKQNQDKNDTNWNNFKAFAGNVDNSFAQFDGKLDGVVEDQKGMKNNIAKNASDIAKLKEFQQKFEASHGQS